MTYNKLKKASHKVDFCVIGGGIAGMCAAISAARNGAKVALMHDRPVLGGNASSEIRMWICGAHGANNRETGIVEEIELESLYRNSPPNFSIWDSVLYEKVAFEPNIKLFLNCSCIDADMDGDSFPHSAKPWRDMLAMSDANNGRDKHDPPLPNDKSECSGGAQASMDSNRIKSITGWQLTTETWHTVEANYFADCSGDGILAPLTGAEFRLGREARGEFDESIAPEEADDKTMGMSCLLQLRECDSPQKFIPPEWAYKYPDDSSLPNRGHKMDKWQNFWWLEVGGIHDTIHDTEELKHELQKIAYGIWDHIKNHGDHGADNWTIEWIGSLPGKRESRRFVGDHILTQHDVRSEGKFDDLVAYGGWSMDDHHPDGLYYPGEPTIFHEAPSPYGIPYRCLYSKNIDNMFFAGRNISCTHSAMSSTRVMATCATMGQAVGTAAAICAGNSISPRDVYNTKIAELQQNLMNDDCYLPWHTRCVSSMVESATLTASEGDPEALRNGIDRPIADDENAWKAGEGDWVMYSFANSAKISNIRLVFDSDLNRNIKNMPASYPLSGNDEFHIPKTLVKEYKIEYQDESDAWKIAFKTDNNYQRLVKIPVEIRVKAVKLTVQATHGVEKANVFAFEVK